MANANIDSLDIQIKSSADSASSALDKLIQKLDKLKSTINSTNVGKFNAELANIGDSAQKASSGMKSLQTSVGSVMAKFISLAGIIATVSTSLQESMNYTETFNYFNVTMKEYTAQAHEYAQQVNDVLGIDINQWENAQATFMSLGTAFGIASDKAFVMSQQLTQLAYDYSSLKNESPEIALYKLRSAFAGELEPIRNWGTDLSKANIQLAATELGITKTFAAMTQAEKAQLRYYLIMKQSTDAQGDMARTLQSPANQLRLFKQGVTQAARALGNIFIPAITAVMPYLIAFVQLLRNVFEAIARLFGFKYPEVQWTGTYSAGVSDLGDEMDKTTGKAKKLKHQLAGFDEINNLTTNQGGGGAGSPIAGGFGDVPLPTYDFLGEATNNKIEQIKEKLKGILPIIMAIGGAFAGIGIAKGIEKVIGLLGSAFGLLQANPIAAIIGAIAGVFVYFYTTSEEFRNIVDKVKDFLVEFITFIPGYFKSQIEGFVQFIGKKWAEIKKGAADLWSGIKNTFANVGTWFSEKWQGIVTAVTTKWSNFKQGAKDAWETVKTVFGSIPNWFKEKFTAAWQAVKNVFSTGGAIFTGIKEGIENTFKSVVNTIIRGINTIITKPFTTIRNLLTKIKETSILGLKPFSFINTSWTIPQIPLLATGGVVNSPTMAMIGENGAEAVVPLEHNTEWINRVAEQLNNTGSNNDDVVQAINTLINVVRDKDIIIDGKSLARGLTKEINRQSRLLGEGLV